MDRFEYLLEGFISGTLSSSELEEFVNAVESNHLVLEEKILTDLQKNLYAGLTTKEQLDRMLAKIKEQRSERKQITVVRKMSPWIKWIAAASIILLVGITTYVILSTGRRPATEGHEGRHKEQQTATTHDVPPPTNTRAVITLADGSKVYLDSAGNGILAQQNNVNVVKNENGDVVYNAKDAVTLSGVEARTAYNTLYNPRGSKVISLTLSDGTKVWLNSESSLRYPASFAPTAVNREVEITGEAYFEVKHNAKQPFKVHLPNGSIVEDIGTAFNVNAYSDESDIKTTLIEGSIAVSLSGVEGKAKGTILKPGQQAIVNASKANGRTLPGVLSMTSSIRVTNDANIEETLAWKNGTFSFNETSIDNVMKQISRWYDVDIEYTGTKPDVHFIGDISRLENVSEVLKMLEQTKAVKFKIEGRKIIVMK